MIPKIIFRYSWIYDERCRESALRFKKSFKYPSSREVISYIDNIEKKWRKLEKKILGELSRITKLKWRSRFIQCYVVGAAIPFSDPLTIGIFKHENHNDFIDTLTHELIHQLFIQNPKEFNKLWKYFNNKYKYESLKTKIHILVHSIHSHIFLKFFNEKRLNKEIKNMGKYKDYKKSWNIVIEEGYKNIIKEFSDRIKS